LHDATNSTERTLHGQDCGSLFSQPIDNHGNI
jgi:hypothetical protein